MNERGETKEEDSDSAKGIEYKKLRRMRERRGEEGKKKNAETLCFSVLKR
jgi:hypothetical protein